MSFRKVFITGHRELSATTKKQVAKPPQLSQPRCSDPVDKLQAAHYAPPKSLRALSMQATMPSTSVSKQDNTHATKSNETKFFQPLNIISRPAGLQFPR